jgi:cobalt-zinc-cadmium efflux system membrane fusion protein
VKRISKFWIAILAAAAVSLAVGCGSKKEDAGKKADEKAGTHKDEGLVKLSDAEASLAGLKTEALAEQQLSNTLNVTATVEANREKIALVLPRIPGRITSVSAKLGDAVKQGQVLATLDSIEAGEAYSAHAQALVEANVAKTAYERAERLHADQIIAGKEYQRAKGEYEKTQAHVQMTAGKLRMLGISPAAGAKGATNSSVPVTAPLRGTVIERKAVLGELAKTEAALFVVADLSKVWLEANIGEADLGRVRIGAAARATIAGRPDEVFEGKVSHLGAVLDKETRTAKAIVELDNAKGLLHPQMFANVAIETGTARKVMALPESATTLVQGLPTVFVEQAGGFEARTVELEARSGGRVVVKSGLAAGELVVTEGVYALKARLLKSQIGDSH